MRAGSKDWLKWGFIVGCLFVAALRLARAEKERRREADLWLLVLGLCMTAAADFAMVICGRDIEGLYCFWAVQLFYFWRLGRGRRQAALWIGMLCILAACLFLFGQGGIPGACRYETEGLTRETAAEAVLGLGYFFLFTGNLLFAWKRRREAPLFAWGLLLFWLCDLHVGILNLGRFVELPIWYGQWIQPYSKTALWVCYLPSQVLISLSSCNTIKGELSGSKTS